jgi:hypothetical protein
MVEMVALCNLRIRFSRHLTHLGGGGVLCGFEECMQSCAHYSSRAVDLVLSSCFAGAFVYRHDGFFSDC